MSTVRSYSDYRDSGVGWLGRIPAHWQVKRLKHVVATVKEALPETTDPNYELQYLDISSVDEIKGAGTPTTMRFGDAPSRARRRVHAGDTILSTVRTYLKAIAFLDNPPENLIVSTGFAVLRPDQRVLEPRFLNALVRTPQFIQKVVAHSVGVGYPAINPAELFNLPVWIPPLDEQVAIADFLDRQTGKIDALIAKKEQLIELLQEKQTALISHAVNKGLNPNIPRKSSGISWLGQVPEHWEVLRLGRKIELQRGVDITKEAQREGSVPVVSSGGVSSYHDQPIARGPGVVVGRKGTAGAVHYVETDYWPHDTTLYVKEFRGNDPRFVYYKLCSMDLASFDTGTANPTLNRNLIHPVLVTWPSVSEQSVIASFIDRETAKLETLIAKVRTAIERLQEYRTALISAAVTGQIHVRQAQSKTADRPAKLPPPAFRRTVFAAEIIEKCHDQPTFGHVKFQKILHLAEYHLGLQGFDSNYYRQAAGPYDNQMLRSIDRQLETSKWFRPTRTGHAVTYTRMEKAGAHKKYFDQHWAEHRDGLEKLITLLAKFNTEQCEIVSTLYAVWNDFLLAGVPFDDEAIVNDAIAWHPEKQRIERDRWFKALTWMRQQGLVPRGTGKPIKVKSKAMCST